MNEANRNIVSVDMNGRIDSRWTSCPITREWTARASSFILETPLWFPDEGEVLPSRPGDFCTIDHASRCADPPPHQLCPEIMLEAV